MDDAQIRREYFRRFAILTAYAVAIAVVAVIPVIYLNPVHKNPFVSWFMICAVLISAGVLAFAANFYVKRRKPLFTRSQVEGPRSLAASFLNGIFFYIGVSVMPDIIDGDLNWQFELLGLLIALVSVGPPWIRFWRWQDKLLSDLPHNSSLIEPPARLPA